MITQKNSIENFLQSVCRFVSTEERAKDIRDELRDHIDSYIDEYTNDGMTIEAATSSALKQMGDPYNLSTNFKDNNSNKGRIFMVGLIGLFMLILLSTNIYAYMTNIYTFLEIFINIAFIICYIPLIILPAKAYKKSKILGKDDPIFYIQSYKESNWYEILFKPIKWLFIFSFLITTLSYLTEFKDIPQNEISSETLNTIRLLTMDLIIIIMFSCSGPKAQNNIVYTDGILTFESFIPWNNIAGYRWVKEHSKNKIIYSIELKFKKNSSSKFSFRSQFIKVSSYQINLIEELFKVNNIEQRKFF